MLPALRLLPFAFIADPFCASELPRVPVPPPGACSLHFFTWEGLLTICLLGTSPVTSSWKSLLISPHPTPIWPDSPPLKYLLITLAKFYFNCLLFAPLRPWTTGEDCFVLFFKKMNTYWISFGDTISFDLQDHSVGKAIIIHIVIILTLSLSNWKNITQEQLTFASISAWLPSSGSFSTTCITCCESESEKVWWRKWHMSKCLER